MAAPSDMIAFVDALAVPFSTVTALIVALAIRREEDLTRHLEKLEAIWDQYEVYEKRTNAKIPDEGRERAGE